MGMPVIGLATTELSSVIDNGYSGFIHTDVTYLIDKMNLLLDDAALAAEIGSNGREVALERFNIERFTAEWEALFSEVTGKGDRKKLHIVS